MVDSLKGSEKDMLRQKKELEDKGYLVLKHYDKRNIPDGHLYGIYYSSWSIFQPWAIDAEIDALVARMRDRGVMTLVSPDRIEILRSAFNQTKSLVGEVWEAGVFQGGTARLLQQFMVREDTKVPLRLFDSYSGMPPTDDVRDIHKEGDFANTSLEAVRDLVGDDDFVHYHKGFVPSTFKGLGKSKIRLFHIDLDLYDGIKTSCEFAYERMPKGGIFLFDDYGFDTTPGARMAVDEFFADKPEAVFVLPTGQAIVHKL
jgi:O-methyltransferase